MGGCCAKRRGSRNQHRSEALLSGTSEVSVSEASAPSLPPCPAQVSEPAVQRVALPRSPTSSQVKATPSLPVTRDRSPDVMTAVSLALSPKPTISKTSRPRPDSRIPVPLSDSPASSTSSGLSTDSSGTSLSESDSRPSISELSSEETQRSPKACAPPSTPKPEPPKRDEKLSRPELPKAEREERLPKVETPKREPAPLPTPQPEPLKQEQPPPLLPVPSQSTPTLATAQVPAREKSPSSPGPVIKTEHWGSTAHTSCTEYRIRLPLSLAEFERAQIHTVCESSKKVTGEGSGVEVLTTELFGPATANNPTVQPPMGLPGNSGIYTEKIYRLQPFIPAGVRAFLTKEFMTMEEESWNAYPLCKTIITNGKWRPEDFLIMIYTLYVAGDDADLPNALSLPPELLRIRKIQTLDITDDELIGGADSKGYKAAEDPKRLRTCDLRGPFFRGWHRGHLGPQMVVYKVVVVRLHFHLLGGRLRSWALDKSYPSIFSRFHRVALCSYDEWSWLSLSELREREVATALQLQELRDSTPVITPSTLALDA